MNGRKHRGLCPSHGFTLLEVLVAMAITAVLVSLAWTAYVGHIARARRAAARTVLMETAQFMERQYASRSTYAFATTPATLPDRLQSSPPGAGTGAAQYLITVTAADALSYQLTATPVQGDPDCGNLTLTHTGERGRSAGRLTVAECWR